MNKFKYKGEIITYAGFKMEDKYCFYGYFENSYLYLNLTQIKKLETIEETIEEFNNRIEIENYFKNGI